MGNLLANQVAVITGASRGIGREIALRYAGEGAHVVINGNNIKHLTEVQTRITGMGRICKIVDGDIAEPKTSEQLVDCALTKFGRVDILVNNAGINDRQRTLEMTLDDWQKVMDVNLNGTFYACKAVLSVMKNQNSGCIVNITSANGKTPHPNAAPSYGASKAAVTYLTRHFALEFGVYNIRVNALQCGPIESDMTRQWDPDYRSAMLENIPLKRLGLPQDAANGALFLASPMSAFITGTSLNMSGGKLME